MLEFSSRDGQSFLYIEAHSHHHSCPGKAKDITCSQCVSVALVIQHAMCMHHVIL